ncbi:hypothetical protein [Maritalea mobilis]|uniref:hypothetical protein n=1 Tax=Maritalea mobilis TaxID=483324 RepID=UPI00105CED1B|nr:hypothetical protein [Maritalea mobilis]
MTNNFKPMDVALQRLFTTIREEQEKRAATLEVGREEEAYGHRPVCSRVCGGETTANVIDFAQWKKKRTARL